MSKHSTLNDGTLLGVTMFLDNGYTILNKRIKLPNGKYITEGLIKTHPIEQAVRNIKKKYNLTDNGTIFEMLKNRELYTCCPQK